MSWDEILAEQAARDAARAQLPPAGQLRAFLERGGRDGWLLSDMDSDAAWAQATALMERGWVTYRGVYTGTGTFALTDAGRAALRDPA